MSGPLQREGIVALGLLLASMASPFAASANAAPVAMVTDLQGKATTSIDGRSRDVTILTELEPDATVKLGPGATLVALYVNAGEEYAFRGPATITFRPALPETTDGAPPQRRGPALGGGASEVRIKSVGISQLAIVMRGTRPQSHLELLAPTKTVTLESRPVFVWKALEPGLEYAFRLEDDNGYAIVEAEVNGTSFTPPASVRLVEGRAYTWRISAQAGNGGRYSSESNFAIAGHDLRDRARALRPAPSAPVSQRIAYAAWLEQMNLKEEARRYWHAASIERPEDPQLKALADE